MIDTTDIDHGPFASFEKAMDYMLSFLNMSEEEYLSNYDAQELVYISKRQKVMA